MFKTNVISSNISSIGYENNILEIEFLNGSVYQYSGVSENTYISLMNASSHGTYFNSFIKGVYPYYQI
jgi:KTSC domain